MFHLGWFLLSGFGVPDWRGAYSGRNSQEWMKPEFYRDMASSLERGGFDYVLIEDTMMVEDTYGRSTKTSLNRGLHAPKSDPLVLAPLMTQGSRHIGVVPTVSTTVHHPYVAARMLATLDHLTEGRVGANIVTSVTHRLAQNIGLDQLPAHDVRYRMAEEWLECATALWNSWEPDAVVNDPVTPMYVDHTKVHPIDFRGEFFSSRGPLSTVPGPQRRPAIAQAGASPAGRDLAAKQADTMLAHAVDAAQMKAFREDMHERLVRFGRKPSDLKILFLASPVLGDDDAHAQERDRQRLLAQHSEDHLTEVLWYLSYMSGGEVDFSTFDPDTPLPELQEMNGERSGIAAILDGNEDKTLRDIAAGRTARYDTLGLVGSPDTVASKMGELMDEVGGDGFLILPHDMSRRSVAEFADGLAPALRSRGLIRDGYTGSTLREHLAEF